MKTLKLVSFQKRQNISPSCRILISEAVRCQLCSKLSLFQVALQISTHAFVRESIKNGSFVLADERQYSDISINMSLFNTLNVSITMISYLSNARVKWICCSRSQPHSFSWLYYVIYAEVREKIGQSQKLNAASSARFKPRILHEPNQILSLNVVFFAE